MPLQKASVGRRQDLVFGIVSVALQVVAGVVMLPLTAVMLSSAELTFWYVFLTIQALAVLIEFGFAPTFARNITYALAGARSIEAKGVPTQSSGGPNMDLFAQLVSVSRRLSHVLAFVVLVIVGIGGTVYSGALLESAQDAPRFWLAWGIFLGSIYLQIAMNWQTSLVLGADRMADHYKIYISSRLTQVVLSVIGLLILPDLLSLAIAHAASIVVSRVHSHLVIRDLLSAARARPVRRGDAGAVLAKLWPTALCLGGVTIGEFLSSRVILLIVSLAVGAIAAAEFAVSLQAMLVLLSVAQVGASISLPRIAAARVRGDRVELRELYAFAIAAAFIILGFGLVALVTVGELLLALVGSNTFLPDPAILLVLSLTFLMTANMQIAASVIMSANRVPHTRAVLVTGAATAIAVSLAAWAGADLLSLVLVQALAIGAYNAWKWPKVAFEEAGLNGGNFLASTLAGARRIFPRRTTPPQLAQGERPS